MSGYGSLHALLYLHFQCTIMREWPVSWFLCICVPLYSIICALDLYLYNGNCIHKQCSYALVHIALLMMDESKIPIHNVL